MATSPQIFQDPDFLKLELKDKIQVFSGLDKDFASLPSLQEKATVMQGLIAPLTPDERVQQQEAAYQAQFDDFGIAAPLAKAASVLVGIIKTPFQAANMSSPGEENVSMGTGMQGGPRSTRMVDPDWFPVTAQRLAYNMDIKPRMDLMQAGSEDKSAVSGTFKKIAGQVPLLGTAFGSAEQSFEQGHFIEGAVMGALAAEGVAKPIAGKFSAARFAVEDKVIAPRIVADAPADTTGGGVMPAEKVEFKLVQDNPDAHLAFEDRPQSANMPPEMKAAIRQAGGVPVGIQESGIPDKPGLVMFNDPLMGNTTRAVPVDAFSAESVAARLDAGRTLHLDVEDAARMQGELKAQIESPQFAKLSAAEKALIEFQYNQLKDSIPPSLSTRVATADAAKADLPGADAELPEAGSAAVRNPNIISGLFGFTVDTMRAAGEHTNAISDLILKAADSKGRWIGQTLKTGAQLVKGLDSIDRKMLGELLERDPDEALGQTSERFGRAYTADLVERAKGAREIFNGIIDQVQDRQSSAAKPLSVGYLENYFTHIKDENPGIAQQLGDLFDYHFYKGIGTRLSDAVQGKLGMQAPDMPRVALRNILPSSRFLKERNGGLKDYAMDFSRVFPAYVESMGRVLFDRPAIDNARAVLGEMEPSLKRSLSNAYIDNYARLDSYPQLTQSWRSFTRGMMRTHAAAFIAFNPVIQGLHLARLGVVFSELEPKYFAKGVAEVASNPAKLFQETSDAGIVPGTQTPWQFLKLGDKVERVGNLWNVGTFVPDAIAFSAYRAKFMEAGLSLDEATSKAATEAKNLSMSGYPERKVGIFQNTGTYLDPFRDLALQYKQIPLRLIDYYARTIARVAENPGRAVRLAMSTAALAFIEQQTGARLLHFGHNIMSTEAPSIHVMSKIGQSLGNSAAAAAQGDQEKANSEFEKALKDTLTLLPGGGTVRRGIEKGAGAVALPELQTEDSK